MIKVCQVCINCIYIGYFLKNNLFKIIYTSLVPKICHFNTSSQLASHIIKVIANKRWFIASIKLTKYWLYKQTNRQDITAMARSGGNSVPERPMIGTIREKIPKKTSIMITAGMAILVSMTNRYVDNEAEKQKKGNSIIHQGWALILWFNQYTCTWASISWI